eukprot:Gb_32390 [translate_table: standard]
MAECSASRAARLEETDDDDAGEEKDLEQELQEAIDASLDEYAFQLQVEEVIAFSDSAYASEVQLQEALIASAASTSTHMGSSSNPSSSTAAEEDPQEFREDDDPAQEAGAKRLRSGCNLTSMPKRARRAGKEVVEEIEGNENALAKVLCGICLEAKKPSEIFDNLLCSHQFCSNCIVQHIRIKLQLKMIPIQCPASNCTEHLTPQQCQTILPEETFDLWSVALVEADIPDSQRFYCPFPECSVLLLKDVLETGSSSGALIKQAECPVCKRLFCAQCSVPWHAGLDCSDFQQLSSAEKEKDDLMLFRLAKEKHWQRCTRCKLMVEKESGCCHMTCRCGYEFCYKCGSEWKEATVPCSCPGWEER